MLFAACQEQQYAELLVQREQIEEQLHRQLEELRAHSQKELQQVQEELARLQKEFKQNLLQAESEKQQVCEVIFMQFSLYFKVGSN